jgi:hypothetical protein
LQNSSKTFWKLVEGNTLLLLRVRRIFFLLLETTLVFFSTLTSSFFFPLSLCSLSPPPKKKSISQPFGGHATTSTEAFRTKIEEFYRGSLEILFFFYFCSWFSKVCVSPLFDLLLLLALALVPLLPLLLPLVSKTQFHSSLFLFSSTLPLESPRSSFQDPTAALTYLRTLSIVIKLSEKLVTDLSAFNLGDLNVDNLVQSLFTGYKDEYVTNLKL